ncbi:uncharacterized protein LOC141647741 isoform X1 [Silene latifolia]|uniref:uncharacterized protein LOC141647741 isoform X1 n=1 Tax=Silene latifolia TaxID=37657 RepID=UPI003D77D131
MMRKSEKKKTMAEEKSTEIEMTTDSIDAALIFHVVYDVLAFLLYMHQQIPSMLQDMTFQFDSLQTERKEVEIVLTQNAHDASFRRKNLGRKRDIKLEIKRLEKLMNTISGLRTAFQYLLCAVPNVENIVFVFGASPRRPHHVYEICFSNGSKNFLASEVMTRTRMIEVVSRKVIRALISKGVGTVSYSGPSKLFLLVKAPTSFNMPLHFLPKREFQHTKKIVPYRLKLISRNSHKDISASCPVYKAATGFQQQQNVSSDLVWFQCRHVIKGLALGNPTPEE